MEQEIIKNKSLELIHLTKEYLQLKRNYDDSLSILISIKKSKMLGKEGIDSLPEKMRELVKEAKDLSEAERISMSQMSELRKKMSQLSPEIKKLSDQLEPYLSNLKESANMGKKKEIETSDN